VKLRDLERHLTAHSARTVAEGAKHTYRAPFALAAVRVVA
jgi:hypothetical protein